MEGLILSLMKFHTWLFLCKYHSRYTVVGPTYKTDGFGFVSHFILWICTCFHNVPTLLRIVRAYVCLCYLNPELLLMFSVLILYIVMVQILFITNMRKLIFFLVFLLDFSPSHEAPHLFLTFQGQSWTWLRIIRKWKNCGSIMFQMKPNVKTQSSTFSSDNSSPSVFTFRGLFIITAVISISSCLIYIVCFLHKYCPALNPIHPETSLVSKLAVFWLKRQPSVCFRANQSSNSCKCCFCNKC